MLLAAENPAVFSGRLTASPSGKFWIPIPMARLLALSKVAEADFPMEPKATPTANPSGILWTVTATISRRIRFNLSASFLFT